MLGLLGALPGAIAQGIIWGIMAIGVYLTYKILDIADLTVDGSICTGAAVFVLLFASGVSPWVATICSFLAGAVTGAITGFLHIMLGIPAILAGILTQMSLWSINLMIQGGKANSPIPYAMLDRILVTPISILRALLTLAVFAAVMIAALYLFFGTELGCSIRATGSNPIMSRAQGINTNMTKLIGLSLSNAIVAFAGALLCQYQGASDINMGRGAVVIGLAAVVIGEAIVRRFSQNFAVHLLGVVLGAVVYFVVYQIVVFLGLNTNFLKLLSAAVVAVFLGVPYLKRKYLPHKLATRRDPSCSK